MNLSDLSGRLFATTTEAGAILDGTDPRTIRRGIEAGTIPGRRMGSKYLVPTDWLRQQVEGCAPSESPPPAIDLDALADQVADRVLVRFAKLFGGLTAGTGEAGPTTEPALTEIDPPSPKGQVHAEHTARRRH